MMATTCPDPARPFRHLCPEADLRDGMTDDEFWAHVAENLDHRGPLHDTPIDADDWRFYVDIPTPCPVCGGTGACGYDPEGRPFIHVEEEFG